MRYYTYLSNNKIDMLYEQISNVIEKEVMYSVGGSALAVKGEADYKKKVVINYQNKLDAIKEQLELEGSLGQIGSTRNEEYISYNLPTFFSLDKSLKIAMWYTYDYDHESDILYKILMYGSPMNLMGNDYSAGSGHSNYTVIYLLMECLSNNDFQEEDIKKHVQQSDKNYSRYIYNLNESGEIAITDILDSLFYRGLGMLKKEARARKLPRLCADCDILAKVYYRKKIPFTEKYKIALDRDIIKVDPEKCKYIEYIVGSPLYVDTRQAVLK